MFDIFEDTLGVVLGATGVTTVAKGVVEVAEGDVGDGITKIATGAVLGSVGLGLLSDDED